MASASYFVQDCPVCGRRLQIRLAYLGRNVVCKHCEGEFEACDPDSDIEPAGLSGLALIARADELLQEEDEFPLMQH